MDGDKKSRQDAELKRVESTQKLALLQQALKKYKALDIMGDLDEEDDGSLRPRSRRARGGSQC